MKKLVKKPKEAATATGSGIKRHFSGAIGIFIGWENKKINAKLYSSMNAQEKSFNLGSWRTIPSPRRKNGLLRISYLWIISLTNHPSKFPVVFWI